MKKLTKQNLDELAATMNVVPEDEQRGYMGMYDKDCYWRCIAFMREGTNDPAIAEIYAQSYYKRIYGDGAHAYLQQYGAGVTMKDMQENIRLAYSDGYGLPFSDMQGRYIVGFNNNNISDYNQSGGGAHAVIITGQNVTDSSYRYYDPQNNTYGTISESDSRHLTRVLY